MFSYRSDFPIFTHHPDLVYLDSAASAQKPTAVIEAVANFYSTSYANIHRGLYNLSLQSSQQYEESRQSVADFIKAPSSREIIFTKNATEAINLVASTLAELLPVGGTILLTEAEHHANLIPWQQLAKRRNLQLKFIPLNPAGEIEPANFAHLLTAEVSLIALAHCSNVLGRIQPIAALKKIMTEQGSQALLLVDASQSVAHLPLSVQELGCDFLVFSSHKLYGPSGVGVLWGREDLLDRLPPYQTGGDMIKSVTLHSATWADLPAKFEAGTPNMEGVIGLGAAIAYLETISMAQIQTHTSRLAQKARLALAGLDDLHILGNPHPESGLISFTLKGIHPHDLAELLGQKQICIRAGHHCAAPLHQSLGITASNRLSLALYNSDADIEQFIQVIKEIQADFNHV